MASEQTELRKMFTTFLKGGNLRGFFIIDHNNISLASSRDINVGNINLLAKQPDLIRQMWQGKVVITRVQRSDVPMPRQKAIDVGTRDLNMFIGAPIRNKDGQAIALLTLRIDPNETLFALLNRARPGQTGEAYVFDHQGLMLSPSRFREDLINLHLIKSNQSSVARVYIRNNTLKQNDSLNIMAASAIRGVQGVNVSGYPDYRGKKVVGAWQWERELDLGLTVEQDFDEAYSVFFEMSMLIYAAGIVATVAMLLLALFFGRGRKQVQDTQNRLASVVENAVDCIVVINHLGRIESVNPAVEKVFGYPSAELVGKNVSLLMPEPHQSAHDSYISRFMATGEAHVIGIGREVEALRADGSLFPAELTISKFELDTGIHFAGTLRDLTPRKQAEAELEAERKFSERVLDSLASHVAVLDDSGEIVFANHAWRFFSRENGLPEEQDPVGMNYIQVTRQAIGQDLGEEADEVYSHLSAMLAGTKSSFSLEYPCHAPDRKRWFQMQANSFESRGKTMIVTSHMDITERRLAEEMLLKEKQDVEESNRTLSITQRALVRGNIGEFWANVHTAAILRVNDWACDYLKYSREELLNMTIPEIAPEFPMAVFPETMEMVRKQGWLRLESVHRAKDGTIIPLEFIVDYVQAADEKDDMIIAFSLDISERKQIEDELRMMSLVAAETDNGVVVTGLDQKIKWVNPGFTEITGYAFDEVVGRKPGDFLQGPETEQDAVRLLGEATRKQERAQTDITNYGKNGEPYILHIEIMPVRNEAGEVIEFIALESDVTVQRLAEKKIKEAKEEAEAANQAKSLFLATMSHEIRTPLNGVVGTIDLLGHTRLDSNQRDMVRTARDSSLTLMGIIDDVLDFSKIEAGRFELDHAPVSLPRVVEGCVESLQPLAMKKNIELLVFCDPAIPEVTGDSVRLRQILFNLTGNAIKFSAGLSGRQGKVMVSAVLESMENQNATIRLSVKDNGIGMSANAQEQLFKPFVQAESSTMRRFGGTGLGLAISKRLVEMMGGNIALESRPDEGALFSASLTMKKTYEQNDIPAGELAGLQLLLVEGYPEAIRIVDSYLRHAGAEVTSAAPADAIKGLETLLDSQGELLLVIDSQGEEKRTKQMMVSMRAMAAGRKELRFLIIGRGRRRYVRPSGEDGMAIDINAMRRSTLVNAVASLAGLESPDLGDQQQDYSYIGELPTREEAKADGRLVLVAEDNETNRNVIRQQLAMLGFVAEIAENGMQALEMWRKEKYALLLTDCHMPGMDGYELTRTIRAEESGDRHTPIIAITADALKGTAEKCLAAGMDEYVTKPMQLEELSDVINRSLPDREIEAPTLAEASRENPQQEAVDHETLPTLLGVNDPEVLKGFYINFMVSCKEIVAKVGTAYASHNSVQVGMLAHKLKSSAKTVAYSGRT